MNSCIIEQFCEKTNCNYPNCLKYKELEYLLNTSNIPKSKQKFNMLIPETCDIKSFEKLSVIRDEIKNFVINGKNIYIYSNICGNGKTTWAIKLMLQYFYECWAGNGFIKRGLFINVPTFLTKCKTVISKPDENFELLKESLVDVDLVIFDDIASTKLSEYDYNILLTYVDQRTINNKSTIYTGNIFPDKLNDYVGERLASRIANTSTYKIKLSGKDRR